MLAPPPDEGVHAYVDQCHPFFELDAAALSWHSSNVHFPARNLLHGEVVRTLKFRFSPLFFGL